MTVRSASELIKVSQILPVIVLNFILFSFRFTMSDSLIFLLLLTLLASVFSYFTVLPLLDIFLRLFPIFLSLSQMWNEFQKSGPRSIYCPRQPPFFPSQANQFLRKTLGLFVKEIRNILLALLFSITWNTKMFLNSVLPTWTICGTFSRYTAYKGNY